MSMTVLDRRLSFKMFVKGIGQRLQDILGKSMPPDQKLMLILDEMAKDVQGKRKTAREIRARMVALSDVDTEQLEPMERLQVRRKKLIEVGKVVLQQKEASTEPSQTTTLEAQLGQLTQEVKSVSTQLSSLEATYATLKESYEVALSSYKVALAAYERAKENGPTLLLALKAHQDALQMRDQARKPTASINASFLTELEGELEQAEHQLKSDQELDKELDATNSSVHPLMAQADRQEVDTAILQEFRGT